MRVVFLLVAACALQGCTALGAGFSAEFNRQRRADAQVDFEERAPAAGDSLVVYLADGNVIRGAFVSASADSVRLGTHAFPLVDVARAERPWRRTDVARAGLIGAGADVVFFGWLFYALQNLSIPLDITL